MTHIAKPDVATDNARLQRVGRRSRMFLLLVMITLAFQLAFETLIHPRTLHLQPALLARHLDPSGLNAAERVESFFIVGIAIAPILWALWQAKKLCQSMAEDQLFTDDLPMRLRLMGKALIAAAVLDPLAGGVLSRVLTQAVQGTPSVAIIVTPQDFGLGIIGAVLIAIGVVAREAVRLADENAHFI